MPISVKCDRMLLKIYDAIARLGVFCLVKKSGQICPVCIKFPAHVLVARIFWANFVAISSTIASVSSFCRISKLFLISRMRIKFFELSVTKSPRKTRVFSVMMPCCDNSQRQHTISFISYKSELNSTSANCPLFYVLFAEQNLSLS